ncbi:PLP-dependent aminotransferase family protein [Fictibacillus nanhaiensis]|uniref:aminotransferase-like domain-containing protein n=1 Tax=Fictibacillus nanhaiensis TaxID=742169 RepID=UPI002E212C68|nr:PLP-dependent aminotransferase family protein [Fictibacillus nanhaiensis]
MNWKPDHALGVPLYKQIAQHYEERIVRGELLPGSRLLTERTLAIKLDVNRSTVKSAYNELRSSGLITSKTGSGTIVSEYAWELDPPRLINWNSFKGVAFDPTAVISARIREMSRSKDVIDLANGGISKELYPVKQLQKLLSNIQLTTNLEYSDVQGDIEFRETLSSHLKEQYSISASTEEILITSGAQQAFTLITQCLLQPGDAVAVECPSYGYSLKCFSVAGVKMVRLPVDESGVCSEEVIELYKKHRIRMVVVNPTHQNPTGTTLSLDRRKRMLEICSERKIPIVEINFTNPLIHEDSTPSPPPLIGLDVEKELVIYVESLSDTVAPGMRMGWVVGSKSIIERLAEVKHGIDLGSSAISQQIASQYIASKEWSKNVALYKKALTNRKERMLKILEKDFQNHLEWRIPNGGGTVWCKLHHPVNELDLLESCIKEGVIVVPGSVYGAEKGFIRLSFAHCKEEEIQVGMTRLNHALKKV